MPALRILRLARTSRCAMVASGTRKARAISVVVMPGQGAQRERYLRVERQRRVAAREHQPQPVVGARSLVARPPAPRRRPGCHRTAASWSFDAPSCGAGDPVDGAVAGHRGEPGAGAARDAVAGPALQRRGEGILRALLGEIPVPGEPDQGGDDPAPFLLERIGDGGLAPRASHLPDRPHFDAADAGPGIFAATSMASSRSLQSTT